MIDVQFQALLDTYKRNQFRQEIEAPMPTTGTTPAKPLDARLEARISSEQKALFQQAALLTSRKLSEFVVASAQEAATRIIAEHETISLSREEQIRFVSALLNPPEPTDRLRQAAQQYRSLTGV